MAIEMRKSKLLKTMQSGKTATSVKCNLADIRGIEIAAMSGFDAVWIDLEHCPNSFHDVETAVMATKAHDCDLITRTARGGYSDYICPLEADTTAIMVPHIMSLEDAKRIVYYTKFHPIGRRPLDGGNADGAYCLLDPKTYMESANSQRLTIIQIEDPEPLEDLEEIAALPGIDMLFFGPADFSQGLGTPCDFSNPKIAETRKRIADAAQRHGKFAGTTGSVGNFHELSAMGYNLVNLTADVVLLALGYQKTLEDLNNK